MKRTLFIIFVIAIVVAIALFFSGFFDNSVIDIKPSDKSNIILVTSPIKDAEIASPLTVAGRARGQWFFEGSFPLVLLDPYGNTIAEGHATAQSEWTTTEFVKFVGNLQFDNFIKGSKGTLVLKKDNPSGLPENDDSISIPVIFK